jgi:hypothetical protein
LEAGKKKGPEPCTHVQIDSSPFRFYHCGPLAPPFTRAEKNLAFACFRPIIRKNPSREAKINTSASLQTEFRPKLQICNFEHKIPMRKYSAAHGDFSHVIRLPRQGARITR